MEPLEESRYCKPDPEIEWYKLLEDEKSPGDIVLCQGDILQGCVQYVPEKAADGKLTAKQINYSHGVIILTQSCDLVKNPRKGTYDISNVVVCPIYPFTIFLEMKIDDFIPENCDIPKEYKENPKLQKNTPQWIREQTIRNIESFKRDIVAGHRIDYYLLDKCEYGDYNNDYLVTGFREAFTIDINEILESACQNKNRIRLKSPYVEGLSQAYGLVYMRVAKPKAIESKTFMKEKIPGFIPKLIIDDKVRKVMGLE